VTGGEDGRRDGAAIDWDHADLDVRRLRSADVPAARRLSTQAGWNQLGVDWERLLALAPGRCFAGWTGGELVATSTAVGYGEAVGWIGMVLVEESHRGQGFGTAIFRRAFAAARADGLAAGLDATDLGAEVYRTEGFEATGAITRWRGRPAGTAAAAVEPFEAASAVAAYDRAAVGIDREPLLARLLAEPRTVGLVRRATDADAVAVDDPSAAGAAVRGYAILRPGRECRHLGPVVADGADVARELVAAAGARLDGDGVLVDALGPGATGPDAGRRGELLAAAGLSVGRRLRRMTADGRSLLTGERVVAGAGFELG